MCSPTFRTIMLGKDNTTFIGIIKKRLMFAQRINDKATVKSYNVLLKALKE